MLSKVEARRVTEFATDQTSTSLRRELRRTLSLTANVVFETPFNNFKIYTTPMHVINLTLSLHAEVCFLT